jgi:hypothetical protein
VDWIRSERIVNDPPTASHPLAGLPQGGKTVEKRHQVVQARSAVVEAACSISANPTIARSLSVAGLTAATLSFRLITPLSPAFRSRRLLELTLPPRFGRMQLIAGTVVLETGGFRSGENQALSGFRLTTQRSCSPMTAPKFCITGGSRYRSALPALLEVPFDAADRILELRRRGVRVPDCLCALARVLENAPLRHRLDQQLSQPPHQRIEAVRRVTRPSPVKVRRERAKQPGSDW